MYLRVNTSCIHESGVVIEVALLLGLHLHYALHVVLVLQEGASPSESIHACFYTHSLKHSSVEVLGRTGCIREEIPSSTKLISLWFIFREWIFRICTRASSVGRGNSILRSRRPDRMRAGSSTSGRLVAQMTLISSLGENLHRKRCTHRDG